MYYATHQEKEKTDRGNLLITWKQPLPFLRISFRFIVHVSENGKGMKTNC